MLNPVKRPARFVKNYVSNHKIAFAASLVILLWIMLQNHNSKVWDEFLEEKGIDPMEFWVPEYYEEMVAS